MLDGESGRHCQEGDADEAEPSQRARTRPQPTASGSGARRVDARRGDQDVRGEPGGVRPDLRSRGRSERRDVVDEVGSEHKTSEAAVNQITGERRSP